MDFNVISERKTLNDVITVKLELIDTLRENTVTPDREVFRRVRKVIVFRSGAGVDVYLSDVQCKHQQRYEEIQQISRFHIVIEEFFSYSLTNLPFISPPYPTGTTPCSPLQAPQATTSYPRLWQTISLFAYRLSKMLMLAISSTSSDLISPQRAPTLWQTISSFADRLSKMLTLAMRREDRPSRVPVTTAGDEFIDILQVQQLLINETRREPQAAPQPPQQHARLLEGFGSAAAGTGGFYGSYQQPQPSSASPSAGVTSPARHTAVGECAPWWGAITSFSPPLAAPSPRLPNMER
ncbi:unnamed protein product [Phaedon cochleariae]|uniref:Uncharacterized protein n=1 Tax=Phaedon cochleariae TaxID=80249 RepID=A0A9N9X1A9_PHACE|nr:unnamed protein product [Phaedon cochleariae]